VNIAVPSVSIILPIYRQASHIGAVIEGYLAALQELPATWEILLVVNGSGGDDSLEVCRELESRNPGLRTIHSPERGWGRAVRLGIAEARGDLICYTNAARTAADELVFALRSALEYPDAVIKANRKFRDSAFRRMGSLLYNLQCRALFNLPFWDINGTPKVFPRKLDKLRSLSRNDDLIDLEFDVVCQEEGYRLLEIPILCTRRHGGKSTTGIRSAFRLYYGAYQFSRERRQGRR
jgi:glycosyltransferase involved in cell wall biosynthesis